MEYKNNTNHAPHFVHIKEGRKRLPLYQYAKQNTPTHAKETVENLHPSHIVIRYQDGKNLMH